MPFRVQTTVGETGTEIEILKHWSAQALQTMQSIVLSAAAIYADANIQVTPDQPVTAADPIPKRIRAGAILTLIPGDTHKRFKVFHALTNEAIKGILPFDVEFLDNTDNSDEAVPMMWMGAPFDKTKITEYATHATALTTATTNGTLPGCAFL